MRSRSEGQRVLERRAARLAVSPPHESASPTPALLTVVTAGRRFAIGSRHARQIVRNEKLCRLPVGEDELVGLVMVGGVPVPVADLASLLGLAAADRTRPFVVLVDGGDSPLGLLTDEVESFGPMTGPTIQEPPRGRGDVSSPERGVTSDGVVLLDTELLLADPRSSRLVSSAHAGPALSYP